MTILDEIENFVDAYLPSSPRDIAEDKIIHDSVWGTIRLRRHEIALLDIPLIQRLRRIRQTSFAYLTFPSAVHTRFEHSLGCLCLATKLLEELYRKDQRAKRNLIQSDVEDNIRAASLLHDVGHGPFSHSSEEVYGDMGPIAELTSFGAEYEGIKPHEVLSCLIIKSQRFRSFITEVNKKYGRLLDVERMASAICGKAPNERQYEADILNGSFDVDKIEYVIRDGRLMGLPSAVDLTRLLTSIDIDLDRDTDQRILTISINGEITFEQLVFGKMILFNSVYRHQKARVCDCLLKGVFEYIQGHGISLGKVSINSPVDFLWLTDDLLSEHGATFQKSHPVLHDLMHGLAYRRLPKRALAISRSFVEKADETEFVSFLELRRNHSEHRMIQREISDDVWNRAGKPCAKEFIWLDMPKAPSFKEGEETTIKEPDGKLLPLNKFFNVDQWAEHFDQHKWRGHVFAPEDCIEKISIAARQVLNDRYGIKFKPIAWEICHFNT